MKKIIIFITVFLFGEDTKEILKLIQIFNNKSVTYQEVSNIYDPFIKSKKRASIHIPKIKYVAPQKHSIKYRLEVVFQNRVRINNNWYKNGDKLDNYIIIMKKNRVYLKNKKTMMLLNRKSMIKVN